MNTQRKILAALVLAIAALSVAGVKVSRLPRTTTNLSNDLVNIVRTVDGKRTNYAEELHHLARELGQWITNNGSGTGGGGSTTGLYYKVTYLNATGSTQVINGALLTNALAAQEQFTHLVVGAGDYMMPEFPVPSPALATDNRIIEFRPGVNLRGGSTNSEAFFFFDDTAGKVTNVHVIGRANIFQTNAPGGSGSLIYLENGSTLHFEHQDYYATNADSAFNMGGIGNNTLYFTTHGRASTWTYDNGFFQAGITNRLIAFQNEIESVGDIIEVGGTAREWGDVIFGYNRAWARKGASEQASIMQVGGRVIVKNGTLIVERTNASIFSTGASTNALIEGGQIIMPPDGVRGVVEDNSFGNGSPFSGTTALWLRNVYIQGATNVDAFSLTNGTVNETILENVRLAAGWASTNAIRAATPSKVRIVGNFEVSPYRPFGSGVTIVGTNLVSSMRNLGTLVNHGAAFFSNAVAVVGNITSGADIGAQNVTAANEINGVNINASAGIGTLALNIGNPTPSSLLMVNGNGDATNVTLGSGLSLAGTTLSASGGTGTNNPVASIGAIINTNGFYAGLTNLGTNASVSWQLTEQSRAQLGMYGNVTITFGGMETVTNLFGSTRSAEYKLVIRHVSGDLTLSGTHSIAIVGTNALATGKTNTLTLVKDGNFWLAYFDSTPTTGNGATLVLNDSPTISSAVLTVSSASTNLINGLTEDTAPTTNDTVMVLDRNTAALKKVAITNLRGTSSGSGGYWIHGGQSANALSLADSTTYYSGSLWNGSTALLAVATNSYVYIPQSGRITKWFVNVRLASTLGTSEKVTNSMFNATTATGGVLAENTWDNAAIQSTVANDNLTVTAGDYVVFRMQTPVWTTNPLNASWSWAAWVEYP